MDDYLYGLQEMRHRGGIPWDQAPPPRRWHRCRPWTVELYDDSRREFCRCGAVRIMDGPWHGRNAR